MPNESLIQELRLEVSEAIADEFQAIFESGKEEVLPEAKRVAQTIVEATRAKLAGDPDADVMLGSACRQLRSLYAICVRRSYQAGMDAVVRIFERLVLLILQRLSGGMLA